MLEQNNETPKPLIMVVDDNPEFLKGIKLTLEMEGFQVWTSAGGQQALDELERMALNKKSSADEERLEHTPDLILADIMMPEMDGYDFYVQVRDNPYLNHVPFIFLTAKSEDEDVRRGKELGVDDYLPKLSTTEDILASIRGKLKRVQQRRSLFTGYVEHPGEGLKSNNVAAAVIIGGLAIIAFCLGIAVAIGFIG